MSSDTPRAWYRELNGYHWFVLTVCTLGWLFDCLDQQLFNLARKPAVTELCGLVPGDPDVDWYGAVSTAILMVGWATGGIIFGIMGDKYGRAKTMVWTILSYSLFTGLSGFAVSIWDFLLYRFLAGLGVGGQFAVGVTLVAESLPERTRPHALGALQAFSAVGNVGAGVISLSLIALEESGAIGSFWRGMFAVGVIPALLVVLVIRHLKEPEAWRKAVADGKTGTAKVGSMAELFGDPRWRYRAIVGMLLASAGVIGLWGVGVFSADLNQSIFRGVYYKELREQGAARHDLDFVVRAIRNPEKYEDAFGRIQPALLIGANGDDRDAQRLYAAALAVRKQEQPITPDSVLAFLDTEGPKRKAQSSEERARRAALFERGPTDDAPAPADGVRHIIERQKTVSLNLGRWAAVTLMLFNIGAFFGMYAFARVTHWLGRRATFLVAFLAAMFSTIAAFHYMATPTDVYWMVPIMGFCQLSVFGGYAIYFPELFPTRLRSTGTSFCYNIARYISATGPLGLGWLTSMFAARGATDIESLRLAGVTMCACYLIGVVVLIFAPETKGKPLPE